MITINAITPEFCVTLYAHYSQLIFECKDPQVKGWLIKKQYEYETMHASMVPFSKVIAGIDCIQPK